MPTKVSASLLSADYGHLSDEVGNLERAGVNLLHFDVMDGSFVPNITFGTDLVRALRPQTKLIFDTHLMVKNPEHLIKDFVKAGSDIITVHVEAVQHLERVLCYIKSLGCKAGVSLVPSTPENQLEYIYHVVDLILVMSVNPGFGGQKFLSNQLPKISAIKERILQEGRPIELSVDGGINAINAPQIRNAGANILVSGNHIFRTPDYASNVRELLA